MDYLFFGELMFRLAPWQTGDRLCATDKLHMTPGGSEANCAVAISNLGRHQAAFMSSLPSTPLGQNCISKLQSNGVAIRNIESESQRLGLYWLDTGSGPRSSIVHYDRTGSAFDRILYRNISSEDISCNWFHSSGITPGISRQTSNALFHCLDLLEGKADFSLDLNYRSKLWQWTSVKEMRQIYKKLCSRAILVTGNESDFQNCLGLTSTKASQHEAHAEISEQIFAIFPNIKYIAVSLRKSHSATMNGWSGILSINSEDGVSSYNGINLEIDAIIDRLGTGDAFTAGILHGLQSFDDFQYILDFAITLSALKHTIYGDFSNFNEAEVKHAMATSQTGIIQR